MTDLVRAHTLALRVDLEGFLARECPSCSRQFKLRVVDRFSVNPDAPTLNEGSPSEAATGHCPLCHEIVVGGNWRTHAQQQFIRNCIVDAVTKVYSSRFLSASMGSRALVELNGFPLGAVSEAPREQNQMSLVILPCHENYPLKIPSDWTDDVSCFLCGTRYQRTSD
jgi:hypothetical protein